MGITETEFTEHLWGHYLFESLKSNEEGFEVGGLGFARPGVKQGDGGNGGHSGARLSQEERSACGISWGSWTVIKGKCSVLVFDSSTLEHSRRQHLRQSNTRLQEEAWRKANSARRQRHLWTNAQQSGRQPKYLPGEDPLPACSVWGELTASTIWRQTLIFFCSLQIG